MTETWAIRTPLANLLAVDSVTKCMSSKAGLFILPASLPFGFRVRQSLQRFQGKGLFKLGFSITSSRKSPLAFLVNSLAKSSFEHRAPPRSLVFEGPRFNRSTHELGVRWRSFKTSWDRAAGGPGGWFNFNHFRVADPPLLRPLATFFFSFSVLGIRPTALETLDWAGSWGLWKIWKMSSSKSRSRLMLMKSDEWCSSLLCILSTEIQVSWESKDSQPPRQTQMVISNQNLNLQLGHQQSFWRCFQTKCVGSVLGMLTYPL